MKRRFLVALLTIAMLANTAFSVFADPVMKEDKSLNVPEYINILKNNSTHYSLSTEYYKCEIPKSLNEMIKISSPYIPNNDISFSISTDISMEKSIGKISNNNVILRMIIFLFY